MQMINLTLHVIRPSCRFCETPDEFGVKTRQLHAFSFKTGLTHSWLYSVLLGEKKLNWNYSNSASLEILSFKRDIQDWGATVHCRRLLAFNITSRASSAVGGQIPTAFTQTSGHLRMQLCCCCSRWLLLLGKISASVGTALAKTTEYLLVRGDSTHCFSTQLLDGFGTWQVTGLSLSHYFDDRFNWRWTGKASTANKKKRKWGKIGQFQEFFHADIKEKLDHPKLQISASNCYPSDLSHHGYFIRVTKFIFLSSKFHISRYSLSGFGPCATRSSPTSCLTTLYWSLSSSTASPSPWRGLALTPPARWVSKGLVSFHLSAKCTTLIHHLRHCLIKVQPLQVLMCFHPPCPQVQSSAQGPSLN